MTSLIVASWRMCSLAVDLKTADRSRLSIEVKNKDFIFAGHNDAVVQITGVQVSGIYWSSTTYANFASTAWGVYLIDGDMINDNKPATHPVWPVRGGQ